MPKAISITAHAEKLPMAPPDNANGLFGQV